MPGAVGRVAAIACLVGGCKLSSDGVDAVDASSATPDAPAQMDASIDATPDVGCSGVDSDVIFYLTMNRPDGLVWPDLTGEHDAMTAGGVGGTTVGPRPECGTAYDTSGGQRLVIPDSSEFDLGEGSIDFYVRVPPPGTTRGVIGRDALDQNLPGHLGVHFQADNSLTVRLQTTTDQVFRCSPVLAEGDWIFVGINLGPPDLEMYVDGVLADEATADAGAITCGGAMTTGIAGNDNPFVVGFSVGTSGEGSDVPVTLPLDGAVDEIRLSRVRRSY